MPDAYDAIFEYVQANFGNEDVTLTPTFPLKEELIDSVGMLDVLLFLESTFDLNIEDDEVLTSSFNTIGGMAEFVQTKLALQLT